MIEPLSDHTEEHAAQLMADGRYGYGAIAKLLDLDRRTLYRWRQEPAFRSRLEEITRQIRGAGLRRGIAHRAYRVAVLADLESSLRTVMEARALDMADVPGGDTGLLMRKAIVSSGTLIGYEYPVDAGLIAELRRVHEQVAKELGQVTEKHDHTVRSIKDLSDAELEALAAELVEPGGERVAESK